VERSEPHIGLRPFWLTPGGPLCLQEAVSMPGASTFQRQKALDLVRCCSTPHIRSLLQSAHHDGVPEKVFSQLGKALVSVALLAIWHGGRFAVLNV
jgi:hypothetical protein